MLFLNATRSILTLAALSVIVPAAILLLWSISSYNSHFSQAREKLERAVEVLREHAINAFDTHRLAHEHVNELLASKTDAEITQDEANLHARLKKIAESLPQIEDIWILDRNGKPLVSAYAFPVPREMDLSDRRYFQAHRSGSVPPGEVFVGQVLRGRFREGIFFQVSRARRDGEGRLLGVTAIAVHPAHFRDFYQQFAAQGFSAAALVRADGMLLSHFPTPIDQLPDLQVADFFRKETEKSPARGFYEGISTVSQTIRLVAYHRLPKDPVYVAIGIDRAEIMASWRQKLYGWMALTFVVIAGLLALSLIALRAARKEAAALAKLREEVRQREASEDRVRQLQKMEAIGQLTGGIAHDFNNLLTIVLGSLQLLRVRLTRGETDVLRFVDAAEEGAQRGAKLTARLLAFARKQALEPKPLDANKLLANMSELMRTTLGGNIEVETVLAGGLWQTNVDANQLENAVLNLAVNARDAMPEGGKLTLETANILLDELYTASEADVSPGQYVLICVTDTGTGMTQDVAAKAIDPFFTTKAGGRGTGLGLSQVYGFVKQSGGHFKIYTEAGHGTTVKLYLPRFLGKPEAVFQQAAQPQPEQAAPLMSGKVLIVEDDEKVRRYTELAVEEMGYTVVSANGATEALRLLQENPDIILLFTDIVMPGMNGKKLAEQAERLRPDLKIIFTTGYSRNAVVHNGVVDAGVDLINKPFTIEQLAAKFRQVLRRAEGD